MIEDTLHRYAEQEIPPSRLGAVDVLVQARRRNRRRTGLTAAVAGGVTVLAMFGAVALVRGAGAGTGSVTAAAAGCVVDRLDIPAGTAGGVVATGIDPSGRYVIGLTGTRDVPRAVLWRDGVPTLLPESFTAEAVNPTGLIVGFTGPNRQGDERSQRPVVYRDGVLVPLPLSGSAVGGAAYAVNAQGDVVGTVTGAGGSSAAVLWHTAEAVTFVATVGGATGLGVTDDGVAVGLHLNDRQAIRWSADATFTALAVADGADSVLAVAAAGDWAAGDAALPPTGNKDDLTAQAAVRWNLRTGAVKLIRGISGRHVSASGTIAGATNASAPALWRDGRIYLLPPLPGSPPNRTSLSGISADGHTLVGGVEVAGTVTSPPGPASDSVVSAATVPVSWRNC